MGSAASLQSQGLLPGSVVRPGFYWYWCDDWHDEWWIWSEEIYVAGLELADDENDHDEVRSDGTDPEMPALVSGTPCPPWAGPVNKKGLKDKRAQQVFVPWAGPGNISDSEEGSEDELSIMDTSTDVGGDSIEEPSHYHSDTSEEGCGGHKASRHCMDLK